MNNKSEILGKLNAATLIVEEGCYIGPDVEITSNYIHIKKFTKIHSLKANCPEKFVIGACGTIGRNCKMKCRSFECGDYLWMTDDVEIGRGGCDGPNSRVKIGNYCMFTEGVLLNPSEAITIGDDVAVGSGANIWTHGSFLDIMNGFPANFAPVTIGNHVWIPSKCTILPGVEIGDNVVISLGSIVNRSLPAGSLVAGNPAKVIKTGVYPKKLLKEEKIALIKQIIDAWRYELVPYKNIVGVISLEYDAETGVITLIQLGGEFTHYNVQKRTIEGYNNEVSEDFRDFLRRRGVKFFTGLPFKSIPPPIFS